MKAIPAHLSFFQMMQVLPASGHEKMQINGHVNNKDQGTNRVCAHHFHAVRVGKLLEPINPLSSSLQPFRITQAPSNDPSKHHYVGKPNDFLGFDSDSKLLFG